MAIKKNREINNQERNEKIEHMELDELKKFLCMKNYQNPEKCNGCPGLKNCKAGQRAVLLLNEREQEKVKEYSPRGKTMGEIQDHARQTFIIAINKPDMIKYLMESEGISRNAAREKIKNWAKRYPEIAETYNYEEKFSSLTRSLQPQNLKAYTDKRTSEALEKYREAAKQKKPVEFVMEKYGMDRKRASHTYYQWKSRYKKYEEPKEETEMESNDEISIADFLQNNAIHQVEEVQPEIKPIKQDRFSEELNAKFNELQQEKEKLNKRLKWIEKAQEALVMTARLLGGDDEQEHYADGKEMLVLREGGLS